VFSFIRGHF